MHPDQVIRMLIVPLALLIVFGLVLCIVRPWRRRKTRPASPGDVGSLPDLVEHRRQQILSWTDDVLKAPTDELTLLVGFNPSLPRQDRSRSILDATEVARYRSAQRKYDAARENQTVETYRSTLLSAESSEQLLAFYLGVAQRSPEILQRLDLTHDRVRSEIRRLFDAKVEALLDQARHVDDEAGTELQNLFDHAQSAPYRAAGVAITAPAGWHDLVATTVAVPEFSHFLVLDEHGKTRGFYPGEVGLMAARAVRTGDVTIAKMAFALCMEEEYHLNEVSDTLFTQITTMIEADNDARHLSMRLDVVEPDDEEDA